VSAVHYILGGIAAIVVVRSFMLSGTSDTPPPLPATPPRRPRKRGVKAPAMPVAASDDAAPAAPPAVMALPPVVAPSPRPRRDFATRTGLRRAVIAQEVLGPPVALRPPRW
jgi:hypothetical protein